SLLSTGVLSRRWEGLTVEPSGPRSRKSKPSDFTRPEATHPFRILIPASPLPSEVDGPAGRRSPAGPSCTGKLTLIGGRYVRAGEGILEASRQEPGRCARYPRGAVRVIWALLPVRR